MIRVSVLAVLALALAAPQEAAASGCYLGPFVATQNALGCPVIVHQRLDDPSGPPTITVVRDATTIDVTGAIEETAVELDVHHGRYDCDGSTFVEELVRREPYRVFQIALEGAIEGDRLVVAGQDAGLVAAAGPCVPIDAPKPFCSHLSDCPIDDDDDEILGDDTAGCATGGGSTGVLAALVLLGLIARRSRG